MNYCSNCGSSGIGQKVPAGDNLPRYVCDQCEEIFYHNPRMIVGCIPQWEGKVLLCRRAIEPRRGYWTLPAGFMENQESAAEGAAREAAEEALAVARIGALFAQFSVAHINQVYLLYLAELEVPEFGVGEESLDVQLFSESEIPWDELAFPVMRKTLELFFEDRNAGRFRGHSGDIRYNREAGTGPLYTMASTG